MGWKCKECGQYNEDYNNNCQNPHCPTQTTKRSNDRWWKCPLGHYNYENQPWCDKCGKSRDEAVAWG